MPEALEARPGCPLDAAQRVTVRRGVAVLPVTGPLFRYAGMFTRVSRATSYLHHPRPGASGVGSVHETTNILSCGSRSDPVVAIVTSSLIRHVQKVISVQ